MNVATIPYTTHGFIYGGIKLEFAGLGRDIYAAALGVHARLGKAISDIEQYFGSAAYSHGISFFLIFVFSF